jgi:hypothetical protein
MEHRQIQIDLDVHKKIEENRVSFSETPNEVLRRVFGLPPQIAKPADQRAEAENGWSPAQSIFLPVGKTLKANYKGGVFEAEVVNGGLKFNGTVFKSPSAAACAATKNSVNGWIFWYYYDDVSGGWRSMASLRNPK